MKFCKDCKWKRESTKELGSWICASPELSVSLVDGVPIFTYCVEARHGKPPTCGPTAKWYEEKEKPIPLCAECKWVSAAGLCCNCHDKLPNGARSLEVIRLNESLCGKYGKWWEKKERPTISLIEYTTKAAERLSEQPKHQSWLCSLICGRKK